jgi:hypothetical protein
MPGLLSHQTSGRSGVSQRAVVKFLNIRGRLPVHPAGLYTMLFEDFHQGMIWLNVWFKSSLATMAINSGRVRLKGGRLWGCWNNSDDVMQVAAVEVVKRAFVTIWKEWRTDWWMRCGAWMRKQCQQWSQGVGPDNWKVNIVTYWDTKFEDEQIWRGHLRFEVPIRFSMELWHLRLYHLNVPNLFWSWKLSRVRPG